jgi:hypothetical protein
MSVNPHQDPATLAANIREALACGQLTNEGTENVNELNAIKLVSVRTADRPAPAASGNRVRALVRHRLGRRR